MFGFVWGVLKNFNWGGLLSLIWKLLPIILVTGLIAYSFLVIVPQNQKLKDQVQEQQHKYEQLDQQFQQFKQDTKRLTDNIGAQNTVREQQGKVKDRIHNVPTQSSDKPFADPGMRERARIMRDYQNNSPVVSSGS